MRLDIQGVHVVVTDRLPFRVMPLLKDGLDDQPSRGRCATDESQQRLPGSEGHTSPVTADLAKQTMLDRVPLRASSRVVTHRHGYAEPIADLDLQAFFPGAHAAAIAATRVSQHQELLGTGG